MRLLMVCSLLLSMLLRCRTFIDVWGHNAAKKAQCCSGIRQACPHVCQATQHLLQECNCPFRVHMFEMLNEFVEHRRDSCLNSVIFC